MLNDFGQLSLSPWLFLFTLVRLGKLVGDKEVGQAFTVTMDLTDEAASKLVLLQEDGFEMVLPVEPALNTFDQRLTGLSCFLRCINPVDPALACDADPKGLASDEVYFDCVAVDNSIPRDQ